MLKFYTRRPLVKSSQHARFVLQTVSGASVFHHASAQWQKSDSLAQPNLANSVTTAQTPDNLVTTPAVSQKYDDLALLMPARPTRIVVGVTGATGTIYGIRVLEVMRQLGIETHLIISKWALATLKYETDLSEAQVRCLAHATYTARDLSAPIASGSFQHDGMIVVPCSMKTLAAVRIGFCDDLISRAADVSLKEGRKLVLAVRETPLSDIHLDNMLAIRRAGAIIFPPVPAFYTRPKDLDDMVNQSVGRMLDSLGIFTDNFHRWNGFATQKTKFSAIGSTQSSS